MHHQARGCPHSPYPKKNPEPKMQKPSATNPNPRAEHRWQQESDFRRIPGAFDTRMFKRPTNAINPHPNTAIITAQQVIKSWGADEETINNTQTPQYSLRRAGNQVMGGRRRDHQAARRPRLRGGRGDYDRAHRRQHEVRHQAYDPPTPPPVGLIKSNQV